MKLKLNLDRYEASMWLGALSSCAIEGNELAGRCAETLRAVMRGEPVTKQRADELIEMLRKGE